MGFVDVEPSRPTLCPTDAPCWPAVSVGITSSAVAAFLLGLVPFHPVPASTLGLTATRRGFRAVCGLGSGRGFLFGRSPGSGGGTTSLFAEVFAFLLPLHARVPEYALVGSSRSFLSVEHRALAPFGVDAQL